VAPQYVKEISRLAQEISNLLGPASIEPNLPGAPFALAAGAGNKLLRDVYTALGVVLTTRDIEKSIAVLSPLVVSLA